MSEPLDFGQLGYEISLIDMRREIGRRTVGNQYPEGLYLNPFQYKDFLKKAGDEQIDLSRRYYGTVMMQGIPVFNKADVTPPGNTIILIKE